MRRILVEILKNLIPICRLNINAFGISRLHTSTSIDAIVRGSVGFASTVRTAGCM